MKIRWRNRCFLDFICDGRVAFFIIQVFFQLLTIGYKNIKNTTLKLNFKGPKKGFYLEVFKGNV